MADEGDARRIYQQWVDDWSTDLYRVAFRLCGQAEVAEDLLQETFYHAWRSMDSLKHPQRARAWLFQILRYRWSHYVRSETRRPGRGPTLEAANEPADDDADPPLERMARQELLQMTLDELEPRYRLPLLMVFVEGMTCREAAGELSLPLGTVLSRIHRARKFLRRRLGDGEAAGFTRGPAGASQRDALPASTPTPARLRLGGES